MDRLNYNLQSKSTTTRLRTPTTKIVLNLLLIKHLQSLEFSVNLTSFERFHAKYGAQHFVCLFLQFKIVQIAWFISSLELQSDLGISTK